MLKDFHGQVMTGNVESALFLEHTPESPELPHRESNLLRLPCFKETLITRKGPWVGLG